MQEMEIEQDFAREWWGKARVCHNCNGTGIVEAQTKDSTQTEFETICPVCHGTGEVVEGKRG